MWLLLSALALADEYWVEAAPFLDRAAAADFETGAISAGYPARIVRRFQLGEGWQYMVLVEHFTDEASAMKAAERLGEGMAAVSFAVMRLDDGKKTKTERPAPAQATASARSMSAQQWLDRATEAHGGVRGGVVALAHAEVVHFVFERTVPYNGKDMTVRHDYWRQGGFRRVSVTPTGAGHPSVLVANQSGAWVAAEGKVEVRDIGVTLNAADELAPEAVLAVVLDLPGLFAGAGVEQFSFLEGADSGVRIGRGADSDEPALSFVDLDTNTGRVLGARYVTDAGPILFEMSDYAELAPGVWMPRKTTLRRADGRVETLVVKELALLSTPPADTFNKPSL